MSETLENARRWIGFVCPDCRFVFRVPRDHDGVGLVCPSCRRMLKIPPPEDSPPLVVPIKSSSPQSGSNENHRGERKKSRRKRVKNSESHAWDRKIVGSSVSEGGEKRQMVWLLMSGILIFVLAIGAVWLAMSGFGEIDSPSAEHRDVPDVPTLEKPELPVAKIPQWDDAAFLRQAEPLARQFLETRNPEDLVAIVRDPEITGPKILAYYAGGEVDAPGLADFNAGGLVRQGDFVYLSVRTRDFANRPLVFRAAPESDLQIDWESWVGWSEMSWQDFMREKPTTPKLFRVILSEVDYYNFGFSDEAEFQSFRLESPDQAHAIYGYILRNSELAPKLRPPSERKQIPLTLMLSFPKDARADNQVNIDGFVAESWLIDQASSR